MALIPESDLDDVNGLTEEQKAAIMNFMHGAIYCWCNIHGHEFFSVGDIVGGDFDWGGTPLGILRERYIKEGYSEDETFTRAAQDLGKLVKILLANDAHRFETNDCMRNVRVYRWLRDGQI